MAADARFAIEVELISNLVKEFGRIEKVSKRGAARVSSAFVRLIQTQIQLKKSQAILADAFKATQNTVGLLTSEINKNNNALLAAATKVQLLKEQLTRIKVEYTGAAIAGRGFLATLIAQKENALDLSRRLDVAVKKIITYRIAFGVFREATEAFKDMFTQAIDMDDALGDLQKVLRGTAGDIERLRDAAFDFGIAFGRTPKDIVEGFKTFAQQGLSVNGILERTNALMLAVSATTLSNRDAIKALTVASKNFGDEFDNLSIVIDKFLVSEREVPVAAKDFADALAIVGQPAKALGLTLDELNGIVAAIGEVTQKTGKAIGTSLKTILSRATSKESLKAFKNLNIAVLKSADVFRPFGDVLRDLSGIWDEITPRQRLNIATVLGQRRRYQDFLALMNNFGTALRVTEKSQLALNDAQLAANVELDKFKRRIESVNTAFAELKETTGKDLIQSLIGFDSSLSNTLQTLNANAAIIANVIRLSFGMVAGFVAIRLALFATSGIFKAFGRDLLLIAGNSTLASRGLFAFAGAFRVLRFALGPVLLGISLLISAFLILKAATDDTQKRQDEYNKTIADAASSARAAALENERFSLSLDKVKTSTDAVTQATLTQQQTLRIVNFQKRVDAFNNEINVLSKLRNQLVKIRSAGPLTDELVIQITKKQFKSFEELKDLIGELTKRRDQFVRGETLKVNFEFDDKRLAFQIERFSRLQIQVEETRFRVNNFNTALRQNLELAIQFSKPFNAAENELKTFEKALTTLDDKLLELGSRRFALTKDLERNNKIIGVINGKIVSEVFKREEQKKIEDEILIINKAYNLILGRRTELAEQFLKPTKEALDVLKELRAIEGLFKLTIADSNTEFNKQIATLKVVSTILSAQNQGRALTSKILSDQLSINDEIAKQEFAKSKAANDIKLAQLEGVIGLVAQTKVENINLQIEKDRLKLSGKLKQNQLAIAQAIALQAIALEQSIRSSIVSGLTSIPSSLADRTKAENDLAIKRKELEFEIADFRKQLSLTTTDTERSRIQQNILEAQRGLRELQQEAKELGNIFTDVFDSLGGIADIAFRKSTENLVDALLDVQIGGQGIGQALATQIGGSITEAGFKVANELTTSSAVSAVNTGSAITVAHATGGLTVKLDIIDGHIVGINIGSKTIELAHKKGAAAIGAAVQIGAQLIGQAIGGGGSRAGIGAGLGALAGSFLPFPGGQFVGAAAGGFLGGLFDNKRDFIEPLSSLKDATNRNSTAIENNNKLLELSRDFINAPARFVPNSLPTQGSFSGGITVQNVNINASTTAGGTAAARGFISELDKSFNNSVRSNRSTARTFG